jgi:hypothetical protein
MGLMAHEMKKADLVGSAPLFVFSFFITHWPRRVVLCPVAADNPTGCSK